MHNNYIYIVYESETGIMYRYKVINMISVIDIRNIHAYIYSNRFK